MQKLSYILFLSSIYLCSSCNLDTQKQVEKRMAEKQEVISELQDQIDHLQSTNNSLLDRMADLSIINRNDAESIRNSINTLNKQFAYINELSSEIEKKDSINQLLATSLKSSLINYDDEDIIIEVRGSAVMVSLSDKMMFKTGSARINKGAYNVLEKVAQIINNQEDMNVLVEGHTDNLPIKNRLYRDNWDLSVNRATAVVRMLQYNFNVEPKKLTAAGRSEYLPKSDNDNELGRKTNRRTEITITPKLDQFFRLLESAEEFT